MSRYKIYLIESDFIRNDGARFGAQFIEILDKLDMFLPVHIWYGADIRATDKRGFKEDLFMETRIEPFFENYQANKLKKIGSLNILKEKSQRVFQFQSGTFAAFEKDVDILDNVIEVVTDGERSLEVGKLLVEVRIDEEEGWYLLYSDNFYLMKSVGELFNVERMWDFKENKTVNL